MNEAQSNKIPKKLCKRQLVKLNYSLSTQLHHLPFFLTFLVGAKRKMKNKCICLYSVILSPSIILVSRILFSIKYLVKKHYLISFSISKCESQVALKILSLNIMRLHIKYVYQYYMFTMIYY